VKLNSPVSLAAALWIAVIVGSPLAACQCKSASERAVEERNHDLSQLPQGVGGVMEQLAAEAAARRKEAETISIEAVLERSKVPSTPPHQVLGRTLLAHYCASAESSDGFTVTVCEYPSVEQATHGAAEAKLVHGAVSGWQAKARKKSLLEVVARSDAKPQSVQAVLTAFDEL